uniref:Uncharacterized protein n=1 Tax=Oryza rufipogon TaxID=4529 RepID=A0A0E0PRH9_ORYRU
MKPAHAQDALSLALVRGCAAARLHHRAVRPSSRPPPRGPGCGGRAGRPSASPVAATRLPAGSRRRPDKGEVKRRHTQTLGQWQSQDLEMGGCHLRDVG